MCRQRTVLHYALCTAILYKMPVYKIIYLLILLCSQIVSLFIDSRKIYYFSIYILFGLLYELLFILELNKSIIINGYVILSILYLGYFYILTISNKKLRLLVKYFVSINVLLVIYYLLSLSYKIYNQPIILFLCVYAVVLSLIFFVDMIVKPRQTKLSSEFPFWVSCGLLFWATMFIFTIGAINYLSHTDTNFLRRLQIGFYLTNIIVYSIYLYGMVLNLGILNQKK